MDLTPFSRIDPCGFPGLQMTDVCTEASTDFFGSAAATAASGLHDLANRFGASLIAAIEG